MTMEDVFDSLFELYSPEEIFSITGGKPKQLLALYEYSKEEIVEIRALDGMTDEVVYIDTPDGYQRISKVVHKGMQDGHLAECNGKEIIVTGDHFFQTSDGWKWAEDISEGDEVFCDDGLYHAMKVTPLDRKFNIYDLEIDHPNHRYYADGLSSHNTGVGKSAALVALGANMARDGEDVVYVTLEMSEEKISQRFEANFLDTPINDITDLSEDQFKSGLSAIKAKTVGRVVVKEFPTATINVNNIEALLDELEIKRNFKPTVLIIDYLNLMKSSRVSGDTLYSTVKSIAEEVRGLAVSRELCIITATQANKEGNNSKLTDIDTNNVGESKALADTVDFLCGMIYPEDMRDQQLQIWKVLKNRFGGTVNYKIAIRTEHDKSQIWESEDDMKMSGNEDGDERLRKEDKKKRAGKKIELKTDKGRIDDDLWD